jgi:hypothetical protein
MLHVQDSIITPAHDNSAIDDTTTTGTTVATIDEIPTIATTDKNNTTATVDDTDDVDVVTTELQPVTVDSPSVEDDLPPG